MSKGLGWHHVLIPGIVGLLGQHDWVPNANWRIRLVAPISAINAVRRDENPAYPCVWALLRCNRLLFLCDNTPPLQLKALLPLQFCLPLFFRFLLGFILNRLFLLPSL